jgi:TrmH family RNA methyltransferase
VVVTSLTKAAFYARPETVARTRPEGTIEGLPSRAGSNVSINAAFPMRSAAFARAAIVPAFGRVTPRCASATWRRTADVSSPSPMPPLTSRHNPLFKRLRDAIREHADEIVLEGPKAVADAIANGWRPIVTITRGATISEELFDALAETKSSQGVLALFERPRATLAALLARRDTIVVALDGVQDPGNVGTIVRLAAAFDAAGVALLPGCADPFGPKAIRASVGAILSVPIVDVTAADLLASGLPLFAADAGGAHAALPARGAILILGSEGRGISEELRTAATPIAIATSQRVESLNVASSAAILLDRSFAARMALATPTAQQ